MSSVLEAKTAMRRLAAEAQSLVQNKSLTTVQKNARLTQIESEVQAHQETLKMAATANRLLSGSSSAESNEDGAFRAAKGMYANLAAKGFRPVGTPQLDLSEESLKELYEAAVAHKSLAVTTKATDSTSIAPATITDFQLPPVTMRREPTRVLSLIPTVATDGPSVTWYSTTGTAAAAAVAEGGTKPTSTLSYTSQLGTVTKLAHVVEVTDETLEDFPAFMSVLSQDMTDGLIKAENDELLNATVTGAHKFPGLLNASGVLVGTPVPGTPTQTDRLDAIGAAIDGLRVGSSYTEPDGIIMHPTTWGVIRRNKDTTNQYLLSDPGTAADPRIWGVPVVLTTQIATGTVLIGDFANSTAAYVRDGIRVETANQGSTQFVANTTLVRCEERLLVTVPRPSGLIKVTGF